MGLTSIEITKEEGEERDIFGHHYPKMKTEMGNGGLWYAVFLSRLCS